MNRGVWWVTVHEVTRVRHDLATKPRCRTHIYIYLTVTHIYRYFIYMYICLIDFIIRFITVKFVPILFLYKHFAL